MQSGENRLAMGGCGLLELETAEPPGVGNHIGIQRPNIRGCGPCNTAASLAQLLVHVCGYGQIMIGPGGWD